MTESLSQHTSQNKELTIINLQYSDNPVTIRRSSGPNSNLVSLLFFQTFFCLLSLCSSDLHFSFSIFAFCVSDILNCCFFAVRYCRFAFVNFVDFLRGNSCFAAPFLFQLLPSACFGLWLGVCEGRIDLRSISSSLVREKTSLCGRRDSRVFSHEEAAERAEWNKFWYV